MSGERLQGLAKLLCNFFGGPSAFLGGWGSQNPLGRALAITGCKPTLTPHRAAEGIGFHIVLCRMHFHLQALCLLPTLLCRYGVAQSDSVEAAIGCSEPSADTQRAYGAMLFDRIDPCAVGSDAAGDLDLSG
jgi:hypothetical protein